MNIIVKNPCIDENFFTINDPTGGVIVDQVYYVFDEAK